MSEPIITRIPGTQSTKEKRVAIYCRVSTKREEQEESLETQENYYRALIDSRADWEYAGTYVDHGISGTSTNKRDGFNMMMADAWEKKFDLILVKSISRFARNVVDSQRYVRKLKEHNVFVHFEKENIRTEDPTSEFVFSLLSAVAQDESHSISENIKWTYRENYAKGKFTLGNNRILGYDTKDGKLVPNEKAWIVKEIFARFLAKESFKHIAEELNKEGAECMRAKKGFSPQTIKGILENETFVGDKLLQKKQPVDFLTKKPDPTAKRISYYLTDDHEGLISRADWEKVQRILEKRKKLAKDGIRTTCREHHFFYGKLFCGECGAPFVRRTIRKGIRDGKPVTYKAWNCVARQKGRNDCDNGLIGEVELMEDISKYCGWDWNGPEHFDTEAFEKTIERIEVYKDKTVVHVRENG